VLELVSAAGEDFVHLADAADEFFHDVRGEEGILLDEPLEPALIHLGQLAGGGGHDGRAARGVVHQRHLAQNRAAPGIFHDLVGDQHVERAFEHDEHTVGGIAGAEQRLARREGHGGFFMGEQVGRIHMPEDRPDNCVGKVTIGLRRGDPRPGAGAWRPGGLQLS